MLKRIIPLICVSLLILGIFAPSVYASSEGGTSSGVAFSSAMIDYLTINSGVSTGTVIDWFGNTSRTDGDTFDWSNGVFRGYASYNSADDTFTTELYMPNTTSFTLHTEDYFYTSAYEMTIDDENEGTFVFTSVSLYFYVPKIVVSPSGERYIVEKTRYEYSTSNVERQTLDVGRILRDALSYHGLNTYTTNIYMTTLDITINGYREGGNSSEQLLVFRTGGTSYSNVFDNWLMGQNMPAPTNKNDLTDWLIDPVRAFLNFEIVDGVSFNGMLTIFVVIAFVLWFVKLIK